MLTLKLPLPPARWTQDWQQRLNHAHENNDLDIRKKHTDIVLGTGERLILSAPTGERFYVNVSSTGVLSTSPAP